MTVAADPTAGAYRVPGTCGAERGDAADCGGSGGEGGGGGGAAGGPRPTGIFPAPGTGLVVVGVFLPKYSPSPRMIGWRLRTDRHRSRVSSAPSRESSCAGSARAKGIFPLPSDDRSASREYSPSPHAIGPVWQVNWARADGCTALYMAATLGHMAVVNLLLAHPGINPNLADEVRRNRPLSLKQAA
eukprot:773194-Prorocentrum_minimum.AAC.1